MCKLRVVVLTLCMAAFFSGMAKADELSIGDWLNKIPEALKKAPPIDEGIYYSTTDSKLNFSATTRLYEIGKFALNGGYAGYARNTAHKAILTASATLWEAKNYTDIPILTLFKFEPYVGVGAGRIDLNNWDAESDTAIGANLIRTTF